MEIQDLNQGSGTPKPVHVTTVTYDITGRSVFKEKTTPKRGNMGHNREAVPGGGQIW